MEDERMKYLKGRQEKVRKEYAKELKNGSSVSMCACMIRELMWLHDEIKRIEEPDGKEKHNQTA